jgi:hypothetical protein
MSPLRSPTANAQQVKSCFSLEHRASAQVAGEAKITGPRVRPVKGWGFASHCTLTGLLVGDDYHEMG